MEVFSDGLNNKHPISCVQMGVGVVQVEAAPAPTLPNVTIHNVYTLSHLRFVSSPQSHPHSANRNMLQSYKIVVLGDIYPLVFCGQIGCYIHQQPENERWSCSGQFTFWLQSCFDSILNKNLLLWRKMMKRGAYYTKRQFEYFHIIMFLLISVFSDISSQSHPPCHHIHSN